MCFNLDYPKASSGIENRLLIFYHFNTFYASAVDVLNYKMI